MPRHLFLPGIDPASSYADEAIVTKWAADSQPISSPSQPAIMAAMLGNWMSGRDSVCWRSEPGPDTTPHCLLT